MSIFSLQGTPNQRAIVEQALALCDFPFERLVPELAGEAGRQTIPVDWQDLSRYSAKLEQAAQSGGHLHIHENDDTAHPVSRVVEGRERVLGLAWYSGRVTLDLSLESDPRLAMEVFLAEGAHMVDFFYMTGDHRRAIVNALHHQQLASDVPVDDGIALHLDGHICSWFDVGGYHMWVGEAFMEAFIESFSPVKVTIELGHPVSPPAAAYIRRALLGPLLLGTAAGKTYHRPGCPFIRPSWVWIPKAWLTPLDAERAGRRACRVCRPT